jgi:hypothetical protein
MYMGKAPKSTAITSVRMSSEVFPATMIFVQKNPKERSLCKFEVLTAVVPIQGRGWHLTRMRISRT